MPIYSRAARTTNVTSGQAALSILTSSTRRIAVLEAGITMGAATISSYSIGRPAAAGVGSGTGGLFEAEDPAFPASLTNAYTAYGTSSPTSPTVPMRRVSMPNTIGTGALFTFPRGIIVPVSAEFVIANEATNGVVDAYFVIDE